MGRRSLVSTKWEGGIDGEVGQCACVSVSISVWGKQLETRGSKGQLRGGLGCLRPVAGEIHDGVGVRWCVRAGRSAAAAGAGPAQVAAAGESGGPGAAAGEGWVSKPSHGRDVHWSCLYFHECSLLSAVLCVFVCTYCVHIVCVSAHAYWQYVLRLTTGWTWGHGAAAACLLLSYQIWQQVRFLTVGASRGKLTDRKKLCNNLACYPS